MRLIILALILLTGLGGAMALAKTLVLFSEVNGRLVDGSGAPVPDILIERAWNAPGPGAVGEDSTRTDSDGRFRFPEVTTRSILVRFVPQEVIVMQELRAIRGDGETVSLYRFRRSDYERDGEITGTPYAGPGLNISCNIDGEARSGEWFLGVCHPM